MGLDLTKVVPIYQENIDLLINQLGKNVTLYFYPSVTPTSEDFFDPVRGENTLKPNYKQTNSSLAPTVLQETRVIKALTKWSPKEYLSEDAQINTPFGYLRLKTFLTDVSDLQRCEFIVPNSDVAAVIGAKYKLDRQPQPVGLQEDRYAITYWKMIV